MNIGGCCTYPNQVGGNTKTQTKESESSYTAQNSEKEEVQANEESDERSAAVTEFIDALKKYGAAGYYLKQNQEKIDELIEKKKAELESKYGINNEPPLPESEKAAALDAMNEELEEYKKALYEELKERSKNEQKEKTSQVNTESNLSRMLQLFEA